jgi:S-layer homology domain.
MKRFISVLLIFVIIFSLFSEFVSADITVFITKTGTKYHYAGCKYLKSSSPISLSTALARGYTPCSECVLSHSHTWNSGNVTTAATCAKAGVRTYTCTVCGQTKTESISATGNHTWNTGKITTAATCSKAGVRTFTCTVCGKTRTESISATGIHTWNNGIITSAATCSKAGVRTFTCTGCGTQKTEIIPVNPNAHEWKCIEVYSEPDGDQHGYGKFMCFLCNKTKEDDICPSSAFVDVKNDWSHKGIDYAVFEGITNGTDATHFNPDATCTRGQVVTFLWRAAGCPEPESTKTQFVDMKPDAFYFKAVLWAVENGITNGTDKTHFAPDKGCTRAQVVTFLWRATLQPMPASNKNPFVDVSEGYYYDAVLWAVENEITNGLDSTHFGPGKTCTRAQIVTFLYRSMIES